jgi:hypothetical protein
MVSLLSVNERDSSRFEAAGLTHCQSGEAKFSVLRNLRRRATG